MPTLSIPEGHHFPWRNWEKLTVFFYLGGTQKTGKSLGAERVPHGSTRRRFQIFKRVLDVRSRFILSPFSPDHSLSTFSPLFLHIWTARIVDRESRVWYSRGTQKLLPEKQRHHHKKLDHVQSRCPLQNLISLSYGFGKKYKYG